MIATTLTLPGVSRCPARPATGHPQRVLRGWLYELIAEAPCSLTLNVDLCPQCPGFTRDEIAATICLMVAADLVVVHETINGVEGVESWAASVDAAVLNTICGEISPVYSTAGEIAESLGIPEEVVADVLDELQAAGRVLGPNNSGTIGWTHSETEQANRTAVRAMTARRWKASVGSGMSPKGKKARAR